MEAVLDRHLPDLGEAVPKTRTLETKLSAFFATTDDNIAERHAFFYKHLAPFIQLYRIRIGDDLTIKAYSRAGYARAVKLPVYGTFNFRGLESTPGG